MVILVTKKSGWSTDIQNSNVSSLLGEELINCNNLSYDLPLAKEIKRLTAIQIFCSGENKLPKLY